MQLDKLTMKFKTLLSVFTDSQFDGALGSIIKKINELFDSMNTASEKSTGSIVASKVAFTAFADVVALGSLASIANLNKVKGAFGTLGKSIMSLNPYILAAIALFTALEATYNGFVAYADEQERLAEKSLQQAKKLEDLNKTLKEQKKAIKDLSEEMKKMSLQDVSYKWKDLNIALMESLDTFKSLEGSIKALNDLRIKAQIGIDYKAFEKQRQDIASTNITFKDTLLKKNEKTGVSILEKKSKRFYI